MITFNQPWFPVVFAYTHVTVTDIAEDHGEHGRSRSITYAKYIMNIYDSELYTRCYNNKNLQWLIYVPVNNLCVGNCRIFSL